jgi:hypothetical protein
MRSQQEERVMKCKIESLCCEKRPGERPDFCDELCEEFVPADLPEAGASAKRISSVIRSWPNKKQ